MRITLFGAVAAALVLAGCATQEPAPIEGKTSSMKSASRSVRPPLVRAPRRPTEVPDSYRVVGGDTLYSIAFRFDLDPHGLAQWNSIADPNRIYVGQQLRLKPPSEATPVAPVDTQTASTNSVEMRAIERQESVAPPVPPSPGTSPSPVATTPLPASTVSAAPTPDATLGGTRSVSGLIWTWPASGRTRRAVAASGSEGLEIIGSRGQPVLAAASGQVVYSGNGLRGYGQLIIVKHNDNFLSAYAHNDKLLVTEGARVNAGQQIAEMGDSEASEVMLHFEIRKGGKAVGPLQFLPQR